MPKLKPTHPGEILSEEFLKPLAVSMYALAKSIGVPQDRISKIVKGQRNITADTALRLSLYFGNTAEFWMNLASRYELETRLDEVGKTLSDTVISYKAAG